MTQRFPADRTFVDTQRKIIDPWMGPLKKLEPLLALAPADFTTLQELIRAAQETEEEGGEVGDDIPPVDPDPLFSEDYVVGFKNSEQEARLYPLTLFEPVPGRTLISTTAFASGASVDIAIPTGYRDVELAFKGLSPNGAAQLRAQFSEDGGSTFESCFFSVFTNGSTSSSTSLTNPNITVGSANAGWAVHGRMQLWNYLSVANKWVEIATTYGALGDTVVGSVGGIVIVSAAAINTIRIIWSAGAADAGDIELWGIP